LCAVLAAGLFSNTVPAANVVLYPFEEGGGSIAVDASGNHFDGTLVNGPAYVADAASGQYSLNFDGVNDRIDVPIGVTSGLVDRTVSAWIKTTASNCVFMDDDQWGGCCPGTYLGITPDGRLGGHHFNFTAFQDVTLASAKRVNDGVWHHVALSLSGTSGAKLFVDGQIEASSSVVAEAYYANHVTIGCENSGNVPNFGEFFTGLIDDFRVENVARMSMDCPASRIGQYVISAEWSWTYAAADQVAVNQNGPTLSASLRYQIYNVVNPGGEIDQLYLAADRKVLATIYNGHPGACPGVAASWANAAVSLSELSPGTHTLYVARTAATSDAAGRNHYENENGGWRVAIGAVAIPPVVSIRLSQVEVCWTCYSNRMYQVQYRSTLTTNNWTDLGSPIQGNGTRNCITDAILADQPQRYYRVVELP